LYQPWILAGELRKCAFLVPVKSSGSTGQRRSDGNLRWSKLFIKSPTKALVISRARSTSARRRINIEGATYR
jgi:hypothetical protein